MHNTYAPIPRLPISTCSFERDKTSNLPCHRKPVEYAIATGRQLNTGKSLGSVSMELLCFETYKACAKAIHASELSPTLEEENLDVEEDARAVSSSLARFIQWGNAFRNHGSQELMEQIIKPKIADLLIYYISAGDYSEAQIEAFTEGLSEMMTVPPQCAVQHDEHHTTVTAKATQQISKIPKPCVKIQRCHGLYPTHSSSPFVSPQSHFGDSIFFGKHISSAYFSDVLPFMLSLIRFDAYMTIINNEQSTTESFIRCNEICQEIEREWRKTALFVDFIDPDCRRISEVNEQHDEQRLVVLGHSNVVKTAGSKAIKRPRTNTKSFKDPLRNANLPSAQTLQVVTDQTVVPEWRSILSRVGKTKPVSSLEKVPRVVLRAIAQWLPPRALLPLVTSSKTMARALLPSVASGDLEDKLIFIRLQLAHNMCRLVAQYVNQMGGERFIYLRDAVSPNRLPESSVQHFAMWRKELKDLVKPKTST